MSRFNKTEAPSPPKSLRLKKEKSSKRIIELICDYNGCGKVFKKKAGWRKHVNYFHLKVAKSQKVFFSFSSNFQKIKMKFIIYGLLHKIKKVTKVIGDLLRTVWPRTILIKVRKPHQQLAHPRGPLSTKIGIPPFGPIFT